MPNHKIKNLALSITLLSLLNACGTLGFSEKMREKAEENKQLIADLVKINEFSNVYVLERPPQLKELLLVDDHPPWLDDITMINASKLPLSTILRQIIAQPNVKLKYGHGVDPNKIVSIYFEGTKSEAFNILELNANYGFSVKNNEVSIDKFTTKTYKIPTTIGEDSFQLGSSGGGTGASNEESLSGSISGTGNGDGQFGNAMASAYNITEQIYNGIQKILSSELNPNDAQNSVNKLVPVSQKLSEAGLGYAEVIKGTSSIVVRTSPSVMRLVDNYVKSIVDELTKEVSLEITVIEYQKTDGANVGIDISAIRDIGNANAILELAGPLLTGIDEGTGAGINVTDGKWAGSSGFINALRKTGTVSVNTQQRVLASNHKIQEIDLSTIQSFISSAETTFEGDNNTIPVTTIEKSETRDGVKLLALANIQEDKVYLKLNGVLSKVIQFEKDKINGITISSPIVRQSRFNVSGAYDYDKTFIVTHMKQTTNQSGRDKFTGIPLGNLGNEEIIDTLVLLTPRRITSYDQVKPWK